MAGLDPVTVAAAVRLRAMTGTQAGHDETEMQVTR
jgi:hypothetical protein